MSSTEMLRKKGINPSRLYRGLKWLWLIGHCAMPMLAVLYVVHVDTGNLPGAPQGYAEMGLALLSSLGVLYVVFWMIAESMLLMYRFPLETKGAVILVGGFLFQYLLMLFTSGSATFSAFVLIYCTIIALFLCFFLLALRWLVESLGKVKRVVAAVIACLVVAGGGAPPLVFLFPLFLSGLQDMGRILLAANLLAMLNAVIGTVQRLVSFSIWGKPTRDEDRYWAEWEHWAGPTITLLIGAVVFAFVAGSLAVNMP